MVKKSSILRDKYGQREIDICGQRKTDVVKTISILRDKCGQREIDVAKERQMLSKRALF